MHWYHGKIEICAIHLQQTSGITSHNPTLLVLDVTKMQITKNQINLCHFFFSNRNWCTVQTSPITLWFRHWWTLCTMTSSCWWTLRTVASSTQPLPVWSCGCAIPTTPVVRALAFIFSTFQRHKSFCSCSSLSLCYLWEIFAWQLPFFL